MEVFHNLKWGNVCNDLKKGWDIRDGQVVCNQLGYGEVEHLGSYGRRNHKVWLYALSCDGNESRIEDCYHYAWGVLYDYYGGCYWGPVGVKCTPGMVDMYMLHKAIITYTILLFVLVMLVIQLCNNN